MTGTMGVPTSSLTDEQLSALSTIERVCSALSVLGCAFIICTFLGSKAFHRPINRLVFFASVGNIMTNAATLIARSALHDIDSPFCQIQAFLIQMFMCADAYWTLAMACNVYLTFYHKYDAEDLRTMEKWYLLCCYGFPLVPALSYIFVRNSSGERMYGNATLWCWVSPSFDVIRIATFYAPVWICMFITFVIYIRAGRDIWNKRKQLRNFSQPQPDPLPIVRDPFQSMKTTEIHVTSEIISASRLSTDCNNVSRHASTIERPQYSVIVSSKQGADSRESFPPYTEKSITSSSSAPTPLPKTEFSAPIRRYAAVEANNAAWGYTKVAVLFFTAMLVTWIPSSANRVFSVVNPGHVSVELLFASSFVLPLQGFWNALIYITTSMGACRLLLNDIFNRGQRLAPNPTVNNLTTGTKKGAWFGDGTHTSQTDDTGSSTELASRSVSSHSEC